jgi:hypothetical protein
MSSARERTVGDEIISFILCSYFPPAVATNAPSGTDMSPGCRAQRCIIGLGCTVE